MRTYAQRSAPHNRWPTIAMGATIVALLALLAALVAWVILGPPMAPSRDYGHCLSSHMETQYGYHLGFNGKMEMGLHPVFMCDQRQYPDGNSPYYQAAYREYLTKLAAYRRAHPTSK